MEIPSHAAADIRLGTLYSHGSFSCLFPAVFLTFQLKLSTNKCLLHHSKCVFTIRARKWQRYTLICPALHVSRWLIAFAACAFFPPSSSLHQTASHIWPRLLSQTANRCMYTYICQSGRCYTS